MQRNKNRILKILIKISHGSHPLVEISLKFIEILFREKEKVIENFNNNKNTILKISKLPCRNFLEIHRDYFMHRGIKNYFEKKDRKKDFKSEYEKYFQRNKNRILKNYNKNIARISGFLSPCRNFLRDYAHRDKNIKNYFEKKKKDQNPNDNDEIN